MGNTHGGQLLYVCPNHGNKIVRVKLFAVKSDSHVQELTGMGNLLPGLYIRTIRGVGLGYVPIGNFVFTVSGDDIVLMNRIMPGTDDHAACNGIQGFVLDGIINTLVLKLLSCLGVGLFTEREDDIQLFFFV